MLYILWEGKDRFEYDHKHCHPDNFLPSCKEQSDCRSIHLGGNPVMAEWSSFPSTNILFQESLYDPLLKAVQSGASTASISSQDRMTVQWWCRALRQVGYSKVCSLKVTAAEWRHSHSLRSRENIVLYLAPDEYCPNMNIGWWINHSLRSFRF